MLQCTRRACTKKIPQNAVKNRAKIVQKVKVKVKVKVVGILTTITMPEQEQEQEAVGVERQKEDCRSTIRSSSAHTCITLLRGVTPRSTRPR